MPSVALSSQTEPPFSLGGSRPSPHARTLTCAGIQSHVAKSTVVKGLHRRDQCKYMDYYLITDPGGLEG